MFIINRHITIIIAQLFAKKMGQDQFGNLYFEHKKHVISTGKKKRFCIYNGTPESSRVPAMFHSWLHYITDDINAIKFLSKYSWQKDHTINMTGTEKAYKIDKTKIKQLHYQSWRPLKIK